MAPGKAGMGLSAQRATTRARREQGGQAAHHGQGELVRSSLYARPHAMGEGLARSVSGNGVGISTRRWQACVRQAYVRQG
jgi:hypothetical protein